MNATYLTKRSTLGAQMERITEIALGITLLIVNACSAINAGLKAGPIANTRFADGALAEAGTDAAAAREREYPFHRVWRVDSEVLQPDRGEAVYVAPVDASILLSSSEKRGSVRAEDVEELAKYLRARVENELRRQSFRVVPERPALGRVVELALVEVSSTDVARNVLGTALSAVVPGGGIVSVRSSGSTAIEGVVRDASTGKPLFIFADRERGKTAPFSFNDFTHYSHARDAMDDWAEQIVKACELPAGKSLADSSAITLLPL